MVPSHWRATGIGAQVIYQLAEIKVVSDTSPSFAGGNALVLLDVFPAGVIGHDGLLYGLRFARSRAMLWARATSARSLLRCLCECGEQDDASIGCEPVGDTTGRRPEREPDLEQRVAEAARQWHSSLRPERGKTIDHHRGTIPLALVESVEPFDDFIVCFYLNHQQIIAHIRSSHKSYHVLVPQQRS